MSTRSELKKVRISFIYLVFSLMHYSLFIYPSFSCDETNHPVDTHQRSLTRNHLSPVKEESSERVIGTLKSTDTKKEKVTDLKLGDYFVKIHNSIQKSKKKNYEDLSKMIIYSYPLFTDEDTLFKFLIKQKDEFPSFIIVFLRQLVLEALPNGLDALWAAETTFNSLKEGLVEDPLFSCFLKNYTEHPSLDIISTLPKLLPTRSKKEWFERWGIDSFVYALNQRDINLYRAISFADLRANLKNQAHPPKSISDVTNQFNKTVNWVCLEILKKVQPRERTKMIQYFRMIGRILYNNKNYQGALQIITAFNKVQVGRILSPKENEDNNCEEFMNILTPLSNYKYYRELIENLGSKSPQVHILPVVFKDILFAHETKSIEKVAHLMESFYRSQRFLHPSTTFSLDEMEALTFVSQIPEIHDSTLDEMSNLIKEWSIRREKDLPQNLEDWTSTHFYTFLQRYDEQSKIGNLFSKNIYSGKDLIAYLNSCSSMREIDKNLKRIGFGEELRKGLIEELPKNPSIPSDPPVLKRSKTHSGISDPKRKSMKKSENWQRELNTIP